MSRLVCCLILAASIPIPGAAQFLGLGGWTPFGFLAYGQGEQIGTCTYAIPVFSFVTVTGDSYWWILYNKCTGQSELTQYAPGNYQNGGAHNDLAGATPKTTSSRQTAGVGSQPETGVVLANGDSVAAVVAGTTLSTSLFTGSATLQPLGQYSPGANPQHVIAADFNGDGIADLAVSNYGDLDTNLGGTIAILFGKGDGTFTAGPVTNAATPSAIYAADFNGDGKMDLVYGNVNNDEVVVLPGNGDGTFQSPVSYKITGSPQSIVAADFNGDGKLDLASANYLGGVSVLLGTGGGAFGPAKNYPSGKGEATYLAFADLNNNGTPDLIVADPQANAFSFLSGNGDGTFQAPVEYATGAGPGYFGLSLNSGQIDLATFDEVTDTLLVTPVSSTGIAGAPPLYQFSQAATGVAAGDLTGDGYPDMVVANGSLSVLLRVPDGAFQAPVSYTLQSGSHAAAVAIADVNNDGSADVVAASSQGTLAGTLDIALNSGNGSLGTQSSYALGGYPGGFDGAPASGLATGNFDGTNGPDVAAGYQTSNNGTGSGGISVLLNAGGGAFHPAVNYAVGGLSVYCTLTGDFNGDGKLDLAACGGAPNSNPATAGAVGILLGNGDGTFRTAALTPVGSPAGFPQAMAAADVNGDGKLDLVVSVLSSNYTATIAVLLGNGDGTFRQLAPVKVPVSGSAVALLDLDGNGIPDLVVGDTTESVFLLGNGDGTFQSPVYFNSGDHVSGFAVTSWNKDGVEGLAIAQRGPETGQGSVEAMVSELNPKLYSSPPTLSIVSSHTGNFTAGQQGAIYTLTVSNAAGAAPTAGIVTVTDTVPSGLTLVSMSGNNWNCSTNTCTRSDPVAGGFSYDPITVTVNVAANAASPEVNMASVSGAGSAAASASDSTTIAGGNGGGTGAPAITAGGVVSASAFGEFASAAPGSWIEIYGTNLSSGTGPWQAGDFNGINAPTMLDGTSVKIGGQSAFVDYVSPTQVNVQVPDLAPGLQQVVVTAGTNQSAAYNLTVQAVDPGLLAPLNFKINGLQYAVAIDGSNYVAPAGAIAGVTSAPASPGDVIVLYGVGFGPVSPSIPEGQIVQQQNALPSFSITIGGAPAVVRYAGLAPNYVGLYQFNVVVPAIAANAAAPLAFQVNGTAGTQTLYLAVQ
ncbi:MAG TPA: FG-GAP-like repeat-containing protein [Bryobacteraceae bacterium]|nr:FG-GAP-like repeat-containing protein [Bryobacteraceae bacterium]